MKLKCIVIDDELLAREYLKDYIHKLPYLEFVGDFNSPLKAIDLVKSGDIDLMFLDIQMPDISGFDFLRTLTHPPFVIITTAYKEFAIEGFELNVIDYLLKPFTFERFIKASNKVLLLKEKESNKLSSPEQIQTETTIHENYLIIKADRKHYKINYEDLIYIEGQKAYVTFHTVNKKITALATLRDLDKELPNDRFIRVHKSYIVSINKIDILEGNMIEIAGINLSVGKSYRNDVAEIFGLSE